MKLPQWKDLEVNFPTKLVLAKYLPKLVVR